MKKKPIQKKGRFYNNNYESVYAKFKEIISTFFYIYSKHKKIKKKVLFELDHEFIKKLWIKSFTFQERSEKLSIKWLGHSTFLIQVEGINILTDPVFYEVSSFYPRINDFSFDISMLPPIDMILISHNHMDHMHKKSLIQLKKYNPTIFVPIGDKKIVQSFGFSKVEEKMWWDSDVFKNLEIHFLPAKHWSGRKFYDFNRSLWGSWLICSKNFSLYFGGDTAYSQHFKEISNEFSQIDFVLLPIGPHEPRNLMKESHISSDEVIKAFSDLNGKNLIPMHWGTFKGGLDRFIDPIDELNRSWNCNKNNLIDKNLHILKFGQDCRF